MEDTNEEWEEFLRVYKYILVLYGLATCMYICAIFFMFKYLRRRSNYSEVEKPPDPMMIEKQEANMLYEIKNSSPVLSNSNVSILPAMQKISSAPELDTISLANVSSVESLNVKDTLTVPNGLEGFDDSTDSVSSV
ncbi:uncharacterized protein [Argopecten irradians]|uniref:uncharacterized protein isoform X1 n=2 Tax=Argopecten irradians TaxID=31199 RepID=UPI003716363A